MVLSFAPISSAAVSITSLDISHRIFTYVSSGYNFFFVCLLNNRHGAAKKGGLNSITILKL